MVWKISYYIYVRISSVVILWWWVNTRWIGRLGHQTQKKRRGDGTDRGIFCKMVCCISMLWWERDDSLLVPSCFLCFPVCCSSLSVHPMLQRKHSITTEAAVIISRHLHELSILWYHCLPCYSISTYSTWNSTAMPLACRIFR